MFIESDKSCIIKIDWLLIAWATICAIAIIDIEFNLIKEELKANEVKIALILNRIWF